MKRKTTMMMGWLGLAVWTLTGCSTTPEIEAVYTVAPRVVRDLKSLGAIHVDTQIFLTGNAVEERDGYSAQMLLQEDLVSRLDQEARGDILVYDAYFGRGGGDQALADYLRRKGRAHGYAAIFQEQGKPASTLKLSLRLRIDRIQQRKEATYRLYDTPYNLVYSPYDAGVQPVSVPALAGQRITAQKVNYALEGVQASGTLSVTLQDASGRLVYSRDFPDLTYGAQNWVKTDFPSDEALGILSTVAGQLLPTNRRPFEFSGDLWPMPTTFGIIRRITHPCLSEIIRDIIPNHQRMILRVNDSGDDELLMLIRGGAYRDALAYADTLGADRLSAADWENCGVACECLGKLSRAKYCYETALKHDAESVLATEAMNRLGH